MGKDDAHELLTAVVADAGGRIFDLPGYAAVGMAGEHFEALTGAGTIGLPFGSELMYLPDRVPILLNLARGELEPVPENPHAPGEPIYPVAAFNSPGYVITHVAAFRERPRARALPLFSYGGVGWLGGRFRSAAIRVEWEPRQDLRRMDPRQVKAGVQRAAAAPAPQPAGAPPGELRAGKRLPGREEFFPGALRGPAADRRHLQRALPGMPLAAEEHGDQLHPGAHRLHPPAGGDRGGGVAAHRPGETSGRQLRPGLRGRAADGGRRHRGGDPPDPGRDPARDDQPQHERRAAGAGRPPVRGRARQHAGQCQQPAAGVLPRVLPPAGIPLRRRAAQHRHRPRAGQVRVHQLPELARLHGHGRGSRGAHGLPGGITPST